TLNVLVEGSSKVVQHPLADCRRQILFCKGTRGSQYCNQYQAESSKIEDGYIAVRAHEPGEGIEPIWQRLGLEKVVKYYLQGPWFKQISRGLPKYCKEGEAQGCPVGA